MLHPILYRIFYHKITETALLVACGQRESLMENKCCYLAWRISTNNIRDLLPSEQAERRYMPICNTEHAASRTHSVPLLWAALDSKGGSHSVTPSESHHKEFPVTDTHLLPCHCIPCLSVCLSLFNFFDLGVPLQPCDMFCHLFTQMVPSREVKKFGVPKSLLVHLVLFITEQQRKQMRNWKTHFKALNSHGSYKEHTDAPYLSEVNAVYIGEPLPSHSPEQNYVYNS